MFCHLAFWIISSSFTFLYPGYASYKALSRLPASDEDLERWLMYWSIMGCIVAVETAEWTISWLPLYYPIKTMFLLYLTLPQTCGTSYLYTKHLQPFLYEYEPQIDVTLSSLKTRIFSSVKDLFAHRTLFDFYSIFLTS